MSYKRYADGLSKSQEVKFHFDTEYMGDFFNVEGAEVLDIEYYDDMGEKLPYKEPTVPDDAQVGGVKVLIDVMGKNVIIEAVYGSDRKDLKHEAMNSRFDIESDIPYRLETATPGPDKGVAFVAYFDSSPSDSTVPSDEPKYNAPGLGQPSLGGNMPD